MGKKYRIDRERNIGTVLFVVEGGNELGGAELRLLKKVFSDILGYEMQELRRHTEEFIGYRENPKSRIIGLNLPQNQITKITNEGMNELYARIRDSFGLKPENCPLFFLYDRDYKSYRPNELRRYVAQYSDPYGNDEGYMGQLLLSYPAVESYLVSCLKDGPYERCYELGRDLKQDAHSWNCCIESLGTDEHMIHAVNEMDAVLEAFGCDNYNLDNLKDTMLAAYDAQQVCYGEKKGFYLLSFISMALLELKIIVDEEEELALGD